MIARECARVWTRWILLKLYFPVLMGVVIHGLASCPFAYGRQGERRGAEGPVDKVCPTYLNTLEMTLDLKTRPGTLRLLGLDLLQGNQSIEDGRLDGSQPVTMVCYWIPRVDSVQTMPVAFSLHGAGGRLASEVKGTAGTARNETEWKANCLYKQSYALDLPTIARRFNGDVALTVCLVSRGRAGVELVPLMRLSVYVSPIAERGRTSRAALEAAFGKDLKSLDASFRLGRGAEIALPVAPELATTDGAIGIVSAFSYGSVKQDQPVCEVLGQDDRGQVWTWNLLSGVDTARTDYDVNPEGMNHRSVAEVETWEADYLNVHDRPFQKRSYKCVITLPKDFGRLTTLTFRSMNPYIFEVFDVVLVSGVADRELP